VQLSGQRLTQHLASVRGRQLGSQELESEGRSRWSSSADGMESNPQSGADAEGGSRKMGRKSSCAVPSGSRAGEVPASEEEKHMTITTQCARVRVGPKMGVGSDSDSRWLCHAAL
jgi:hypothetical protein